MSSVDGRILHVIRQILGTVIELFVVGYGLHEPQYEACLVEPRRDNMIREVDLELATVVAICVLEGLLDLYFLSDRQSTSLCDWTLTFSSG